MLYNIMKKGVILTDNVVLTTTERKIYKVTEYDLLSIAKKKGMMYATTDTRKLYEDISITERKIMDVDMINTEIDRLYNTNPIQNRRYYIWETNTLWLYNNGWQVIVGTSGKAPEGYYYGNGQLNPTSGGCCGDNNGILGDGSVVVRDANRIIKGKIYIDAENNNLVISSFLGGGFRLMPNGANEALGSLSISSDGLLKYNGEINTTKDIYVLDSSNPDTKYKVWHEGNFDPTKIEIPAENIIKWLNDYKPQPIDLNVKYLNGIGSDGYAKVKHNHEYSDITNFDEGFYNYAKQVFTTGDLEGISFKFDDTDNNFDIAISNIAVSLTGGVTGLGISRYNRDNNRIEVNVSTNVDPLKHTHDLDSINGWEEWRVQNQKDLDEKLDASWVEDNVSSIPKPNYILRLDTNGNLPTNITGNSSTSTKLETGRTIRLIGGATGFGIFDGSEDIDIDITIDPTKHVHEQYALNANVGVTIAPLDSNHKVPVSNLPDAVLGNLQYQSTFDPISGYPTLTPTKGNYWISSNTGNLIVLVNGVEKSQEFLPGDWLIYNGENWEYLDNSGCVQSVNGMSGVVTLQADDIGGIPNSMLWVDSSNEGVNKILTTRLDEDTDKYYLKTDIHGDSTSLNGETNDSFAHVAGDDITGEFSWNKKNVGLKFVVNNNSEFKLRSDPSANRVMFTYQYLNGTEYSVFDSSTNGASVVNRFHGNSDTSSKFSTPRDINISGAVVGSTSFDGSANVTINANLRGNEVVVSETEPTVHKTGDLWLKVIPD